MTLLDAEQLNREVDRLREAGWQEAHFETWVRDTARDVAERSLRGPGRRIYLMGPEALGAGGRAYASTPPGETVPFAQVEIRWPRLALVGGEHDIGHMALALEPSIRTIGLRELGHARAELGLAGT